MSTNVTVRRGSEILFRGQLSDVQAWLDSRPRPTTFLSVCSGIEAASVAWKPLGWRAVGFAEIEKFPSAVLAHHYPAVPNYGDFTRIDPARIGKVDILCGGTPCQAFSVAGARRSLEDARGNLTLAFVELAHALKPRNVVWENVPGVLSTKDNAFGCFLAGLVGTDDALPPPSGKRWPSAGMVSGPKGRAAWRVLDAQYFGLAQRRKRIIVVADFGNGADPAAVLFEPESVRRDSPPSRETGQGIAPTISARTKGGGGLGTDFDLDGGLIHAPEIAPTLNAAFGQKQGLEDQHALGGAGLFVPAVHAIQGNMIGRHDEAGPAGVGHQKDISFTLTKADVHAVCVTGPISHALKAEGADASETFICFSAKDYGADASSDLSPTLRAGGHTGSHANAGVMPAIAFHHNAQACQLPGPNRDTSITDPLTRSQGAAVAMTVALRGRDGGATAELGGEVATALRASSGGGDKPHILTSAVRRLTPVECQRLQGFQFLCAPTYPGAWQDEVGRWWSPNYTAIPYRGKPASECPDGPQYKALGNSWAVPKFRWLGERIQRYMPRA